jgi:NADPH-dependent 2,4-dienoyl-CoA reductase/sulfur reductase-like enzyme/rhodanese-related sulfurtransferase
MFGKESGMKVMIIGGVAGGASCAARLRRLNEHADIVMIERGPYVSYANCGLPYHVGGVIEDEASLLISNPQLFREQFAIDVRTSTEAVSIDAKAKTVTLRDVTTGTERSEAYDKLVLSPGAVSVKPPLPGIDLPGIFHVRTVPDARAIRTWLAANAKGQRAVVIGGGFIGLEMVENLVHRGFETTLIELADQVLASLDVEQARPVEALLRSQGVKLALGEGVTGFAMTSSGAIDVATKSGTTYTADIVILALGVRPDSALAKAAGLALGDRGGIKVDAHMRTSDPDIYAVGDAVEVRDIVTGTDTLLALAGPANRQGRIAADNIAGRPATFRGVQGTAIIGLFGTTVAWTGASEKILRRLGRTDYEKIYLYPNHHARYYPGAKMISMKLIFAKSDGRILGAQAYGEDGVDRRIDVIATLIQKAGTVYDLEEAELCYAPQYGSAKDAANFAGMIAANVLRNDMPLVHWSADDHSLLLDVREPSEIEAYAVPGALSIPLKQLRARLVEIPRDREIAVICRSGQRAYLATRILLQNGFDAKTLSGGVLAVQQAAG